MPKFTAQWYLSPLLVWWLFVCAGQRVPWVRKQRRSRVTEEIRERHTFWGPRLSGEGVLWRLPALSWREALALGVGVSIVVSALRRRLLVSPQASSVSVPGISSVSQLSIPAGFARCSWSPDAAPAGLHKTRSSALSPAGAGVAAGCSHGTVASRSSCSIRRIGSPHRDVVQPCSSCRASSYILRETKVKAPVELVSAGKKPCYELQKGKSW